MTAFVCALALIASATSAFALDPARRCEASKLKTAGKYGFCQLKEESKAAKTGGAPDFSKCDDLFSAKWGQAETNAGGMCPSNGDEAAIQAFIAEHADALAVALAGGPLPQGVETCDASLMTCNNNVTGCNAGLTACGLSLNTCNSVLASAQASLTTCNGGLTTCNSNLLMTQTDLSTCSANLNTCTSDLVTCSANLGHALVCGNGAIDAGEDCDQRNLNGKTCVTQGFAGGILTCGSNCVFETSGCSNVRITENGDGTFTDNLTGLVWTIDRDHSYTWSTSANTYSQPRDGTLFTVFLSHLNDDFVPYAGGYGLPVPGSGCFRDHCDWRIPTAWELHQLHEIAAAGGFPGTGLYWSQSLGVYDLGGQVPVLIEPVSDLVLPVPGTWELLGIAVRGPN